LSGNEISVKVVVEARVRVELGSGNKGIALWLILHLEKKGSKRVLQLSPLENPFWFLVEPFWVPYRTVCGKGST
jgi:hypothetical protein